LQQNTYLIKDMVSLISNQAEEKLLTLDLARSLTIWI